MPATLLYILNVMSHTIYSPALMWGVCASECELFFLTGPFNIHSSDMPICEGRYCNSRLCHISTEVGSCRKHIPTTILPQYVYFYFIVFVHVFFSYLSYKLHCFMLT